MTEPPTPPCPAVTRRANFSAILAPLLATAVAVGAISLGVAVHVHPALGVAPLVAVLYALIVLERPSVGALTLAALAPATAGLGRGLPIPGLKISEVLILGTATLLIGVVACRARWNAVDFVALAYLIATVLLTLGNTVTRGDAIGLEAMQDAFAPAVFFLLYRAVRVAGLTDRQRGLALALMVAPCIVMVAVAFGQNLDLPGVRAFVAGATTGGIFDTWSYQNSDVGRRATGLFEVWHSLAGYLVPLLLVCVSVSLEVAADRRLRQAACAMAGVILVGLLLSQTLNVLPVALACSVGIGVLGGQAGRSIFAITAISIVGLLVAGDVLASRVEQQFDPSSDTVLGENIDDRLAIWSEDFSEPLKEHWPLGYGPGIPPGVDWPHTESLYLTLVLRGGVLLLGIFLLFFLIVEQAAWRARKSSQPVDRVVSSTLAVLVPGTFVMHLVFPYFTSSGFPQVFWILLALLPLHGHLPASTHQISEWPNDVESDVMQLTAGRRAGNPKEG